MGHRYILIEYVAVPYCCKDACMIITSIPLEELPLTDNLFQSSFWATFRQNEGVTVLAFRCKDNLREFAICLHLRKGMSGAVYAYVPHGPDILVDESEYGRFLEELSESLLSYLPAETLAIRYDTLFLSPYTDSEYWTHSGQWKGAPRTELRELRMNFGTRNHQLKKAPLDHFSPDTVLVSLQGSEETILARMRQTTRNSLRRAWKSELEFSVLGVDGLDVWYPLYRDTALRKKLAYQEKAYFQRLFSVHTACPMAKNQSDVWTLVASKDGKALAGLVLARMGRRAYYMYAGSSLENRECMPNYGLQWEAFKLLRAHSCVDYDLMGVPPNGDPKHSMYGLYTFKTGLGGRIVHYSGCWDYPLDSERYRRFVNAEVLPH